MKIKCYAALDIGGTTIYGILVLSEGTVLARKRVKTLSTAGTEEILTQIVNLINNLCRDADFAYSLSGIGLCAAGFFDIHQGVLISSPNIYGLNNIPLGKKVEEALGVPAVVENDANAAALGEYYFGSGRGSDTMVFITASTGIGGGIVYRGSLFRGSRGLAGEIGHMPVLVEKIKCGCGRQGCLEAVASGTAIAREGRQALFNGRAPILKKICPDGNVTAEKVFKAVEKGDKEAAQIVEKAIFYLGVGLAVVANLFNPDCIVVGGGLSRNGKIFLGPLEQQVKECAVPSIAEIVSIKKAALGEEAGVWGMLSLLDLDLTQKKIM